MRISDWSSDVCSSDLVEKPETYAYQKMIAAWMAARGIPYVTVRYTPRRFKHWQRYFDLLSNVLTNATLPSISLGRHSCSLGPASATVSFARVECLADRRANPKRTEEPRVGTDCV